MNLRTISALVLSLAAVSTISARDLTLRVNIPFSFVVNGASLPPGEYTIQPTSPITATTMIIRGADHSVEAVTFATERPAFPGTRQLVFHRYGGRNFLFQIWPVGDRGNQLTPTRFERELAARRTAPDESVTVALR